MRDTGRAVLYLTDGPEGAAVTDWPGVLKFRVQHKRVGSHNIAGRRVDVWFTDSDGREWHGVNYGHNSQLCHCRRLARHDVSFRADSALPVTWEALPAPWCCRRAALPVNSRPVAPRSRPSIGKHCRPVVLPTCCAAGQLPAGCPTLPAVNWEALPARGAADVPRCRSTPGRLPTLPAVNWEALPARGAADVPRCRSTPDRLPTLPAVNWEALPARGAADVPPAGQIPAGCPTPGRLPTCRPSGPAVPPGGAALPAGYLTVDECGLRL